MRLLFPILFAFLVCLPGRLSADPSWWSTAGTSIWITTPVNAGNYAPVNVGQIKHVAAMARLHLRAALFNAGGEGLAVAALVDSFTLSDPDNRAVANVGQLKHTAQKFYDRLSEVGYNWQTGTFGTATTPYPWTGTVHAENGSPCNIGQLKYVFSFELTSAFLAEDADADEIPSWWEYQYALNPASNEDAGADSDDDGDSNLEEHAAQGNPRQQTVNDYRLFSSLFSARTSYSGSFHGNDPFRYGHTLGYSFFKSEYDRITFAFYGLDSERQISTEQRTGLPLYSNLHNEIPINIDRVWSRLNRNHGTYCLVEALAGAVLRIPDHVAW